MSRVNKDYKFIREWKEVYIRLLKTSYPEISKKEIDVFLNKVIDENIQVPEGIVDNNYVHKSIKVDLLTLIDWIYNKKLICGGHAVFFKNRHEAVNPAAMMLETFLSNRKSIKDKLKILDPDSYEYAVCDRDQGIEKLSANSWYGAGGAPTSNFYNLYTAVSTTASGQSLISTTMTAIENFMGNNVKFIDLEDCMFYINNIINEKHKIKSKFLDNKDHDTVLEYLKNRFFDFKPEYEYPIFKVLINLSQDQLNRIYYKNNIYEFNKVRKIRLLITDILLETDAFLDPNIDSKKNNLSNEAKSNIELLWTYYREFVFYNYFAYNRIGRLRYDPRKSIVTVDTDSNMVDLGIWIDWLKDNIISTIPQLYVRDEKKMLYNMVNIACYSISELYKEHLAKYCKVVNIPDDIAWRINIKNEFLFERMILSNKKKRYMSKTLLREGSEYVKVDTKGLDFMKSSCNTSAQKFFEQLAKEKVLECKNISIPDVIHEVQNFENYVKQTLLDGEKEFLIPCKVKELEAYADPLTNMGVMAVLAWNCCYPNQDIQLPDIIDIVKVKMNTEDDIEDLKNIEPEIYNNIMDGIFNNNNERIRKKGIYVIAIPRNVEKIPKWILNYIDYDEVVNGNISKFHPILKSLNMNLIQTESKAGKTYMSNIIDI